MTATEIIGKKIEHTRQVLILDPVKAAKTKVSFFGQGTVGSNAAMETMRLGVSNLHLFDFDDVEPHNLPSQRFDVRHLGMNKAEAMKDQLAFMCNDDGKHVKVTTRKVEGPVMVEGIAVLGVDTMASRRLIWEKALRPNRKVDFVLDFRMAGNLLQCYAFDPRDDRYEATLFKDEDAEPAPCGGRTVSYTGALAGALAANFIRKHIMGGEIPFFTGMDLDAVQLLRSDAE